MMTSSFSNTFTRPGASSPRASAPGCAPSSTSQPAADAARLNTITSTPSGSAASADAASGAANTARACSTRAPASSPETPRFEMAYLMPSMYARRPERPEYTFDSPSSALPVWMRFVRNVSSPSMCAASQAIASSSAAVRARSRPVSCGYRALLANQPSVHAPVNRLTANSAASAQRASASTRAPFSRHQPSRPRAFSTASRWAKNSPANAKYIWLSDSWSNR